MSPNDPSPIFIDQLSSANDEVAGCAANAKTRTKWNKLNLIANSYEMYVTDGSMLMDPAKLQAHNT